MRYLLTALLILFVVSVNAQQTPSIGDKWAVKITPTSLIDPKGAQIPVGIEYGVGKAITISLECSIPLYYRPYSKSLFNRFDMKVENDFKARAEVKLLFPLDEDKNQMYLSWEFTYRDLQYHVYNAGDYRDGEFRQSYQQCDLRKIRYGIGAILGTRQYITKRLYFEGFAGLGAKCISISHYNLQSPTRKYISYEGAMGDLFANNNNLDDINLGLYITMGIKVAFMLN